MTPTERARIERRGRRLADARAIRGKQTAMMMPDAGALFDETTPEPPADER